MQKRMFAMAAVVGVLSVSSVVVLAAPRGITDKAPDLKPIASRMLNGVISVKNYGSAAAGPFKVTVECTNLGGGGCAEPPPAPAYDDAAYPGKLTVAVPGLAAGAVYNHSISFWKKLNWVTGSYQFEVEADPASVVAETNEGNNVGTAVMNVP